MNLKGCLFAGSSRKRMRATKSCGVSTHFRRERKWDRGRFMVFLMVLWCGAQDRKPSCHEGDRARSARNQEKNETATEESLELLTMPARRGGGARNS